MSKQALNSVLELIVGLTPTERDAVESRIRMLGHRRSITEIDVVEQVYRAIAGLTRNGFPPLGQLRRSSNWYRFERGCRRLQQFVTASCGEGLGRRRPRVLTTLLGCLIEDLNQNRIGLGPVTLGDRMMMVDEVVGRCYPGYVEAGLLREALLGRFMDEPD